MSLTRTAVVSCCLRTTASVFAGVMASWVGFTWPWVVLLFVLGSSRLVCEVWPSLDRGPSGRWSFRFVLLLSVVLAAGAVSLSERLVVWDGYFAVLTWFIAGALLPALRAPGGDGLRPRWRMLSMAWALCGGVIWLAGAYLQNQPRAFFAGLGINAGLWILCRWWFSMGAVAIQTVNTMILLLIGLPAVDLFNRAERTGFVRRASLTPPSYEASALDPEAFADWWTRYLAEWNRLAADIFVPDPRGIFPFRLRTNSHGFLFASRIEINNLGLRGRPIRVEKGAAYRIVALGESTTFGCTLGARDVPWPELIESMIADRLRPSRVVEVINAGVPAYHLPHNLLQLKEMLLSLQPDLIVSYHGYNGFKLLNKVLAEGRDDPVPAYQERPLKTLAAVEYRLRLIHHRYAREWDAVRHPPAFVDPMQTAYARAYGELVAIARSNNIRLVLANFSMAVNRRSAPDVIRFYRAGFPMVTEQIKANAVHSLIVRQVARQHPEIIHVDTHPALDGRHEHFIDLVHLTQAGRQQMAETLFPSIREMLRKDGVIP